MSKRKSNFCPATSFSCYPCLGVQCKSLPYAIDTLARAQPYLPARLHMIGSITEGNISHDDSRHPTCLDRYASRNPAWWRETGKRKRKGKWHNGRAPNSIQGRAYINLKPRLGVEHHS